MQYLVVHSDGSAFSVNSRNAHSQYIYDHACIIMYERISVTVSVGIIPYEVSVPNLVTIIYVRVILRLLPNWFNNHSRIKVSGAPSFSLSRALPILGERVTLGTRRCSNWASIRQLCLLLRLCESVSSPRDADNTTRYCNAYVTAVGSIL